MLEDHMYVCVCKGITEEALKKQLAQSNSTREVLKNLGVGDDCGICVIEAVKKMQEISPLAPKKKNPTQS